MPSLTLYTYFRSSAAYRVRIALNLKGLEYASEFVHLIREGGQQHSEVYLRLNPQGLVPALKVNAAGGERVLNQSLAIIEYLDEVHPEPPLLPGTPLERAQARAMAQIICCDIHPLNNLRVLDFLKGELRQGPESCMTWYRHWIAVGLAALEQSVTALDHRGTFCMGDRPGLVDLCLIPQWYNACRFECDLAPYPRLNEIYDACMSLEAFQKAAPEQQADSE